MLLLFSFFVRSCLKTENSFHFIPLTPFTAVAWGVYIVLAWCHGSKTNRRCNTGKSICQVRDRSKALQGMTAGCTYRPHKTFYFFCLSLTLSLRSVRMSTILPWSSPSDVWFLAQLQALKSHLSVSASLHACHLTLRNATCGWPVLNDMWNYLRIHHLPFCIILQIPAV